MNILGTFCIYSFHIDALLLIVCFIYIYTQDEIGADWTAAVK